MKAIVLMVAFVATVFGESYAVQVISVKKPQSLTAEFMSSVEKSGYKASKVNEGSLTKILVGDFNSYTQAKEALKKLQCDVAPDSFIRVATSSKVVEQSVKRESISAVEIAKCKQLLAQEGVSVQVDSNAAPIIIDLDEPPTKKEVRLDELSAAMAFYRASPYYTFSKDSGF